MVLANARDMKNVLFCKSSQSNQNTKKTSHQLPSNNFIGRKQYQHILVIHLDYFEIKPEREGNVAEIASARIRH